ncbi:uncharacterized protein LOC126942885 [Macaca thibetana thibetana]|uniref:uncharacterized protein LOC126942885 n=1 Tax=Macaca thibetana thibetana TaxID=257877 RepID=UPI0021BCA383|nr:uncharacterized protein LOC126942885 [Macaca thibetana thibetana]
MPKLSRLVLSLPPRPCSLPVYDPIPSSIPPSTPIDSSCPARLPCPGSPLPPLPCLCPPFCLCSPPGSAPSPHCPPSPSSAAMPQAAGRRPGVRPGWAWAWRLGRRGERQLFAISRGSTGPAPSLHGAGSFSPPPNPPSLGRKDPPRPRHLQDVQAGLGWWVGETRAPSLNSLPVPSCRLQSLHVCLILSPLPHSPGVP